MQKSVADQQTANAQIYAIINDMRQPFAKGGRRTADSECADIRDRRVQKSVADQQAVNAQIYAISMDKASRMQKKVLDK